jgi:hypothetical protein
MDNYGMFKIGSFTDGIDKKKTNSIERDIANKVDVGNNKVLLPTMSVDSKVLLPTMDSKVYIVDFLNIFSDFREIKYKKENIDFHSVKHNNKERDTYDFFNLFFTKYIDYVKINKSSHFYFVMKKLHNYEVILDNIIKTHKNFNMKFMIIEDKFKNELLDKNKDDFLCQYFFYILQKTNDCVLISNDKYRDKGNYIKLFNFDIFIRVVSFDNKKNIIEKYILKIKLSDNISNLIIFQKFNRCTIPKRDLNIIL